MELKHAPLISQETIFSSPYANFDLKSGPNSIAKRNNRNLTSQNESKKRLKSLSNQSTSVKT